MVTSSGIQDAHFAPLRNRQLDVPAFPSKQQWIREEALANIVAVEVVDLPVSEFQAKIEEEFSHTSSKFFKKK
ncbi:unnamed protein product [Trichobilharzia regenti]|nr:unnamed protein product [Trichobilharzia regenti]